MTYAARNLMLTLLVAVLPVAVFAQDELLDEEQPPIKYYTVEIVVFAYEENVSVGTEVFPGDPVDAPDDELEQVAEIDVESQQRRHPDFIGLEPVLLQRDEFTMQDVVRKFELLDAYKQILHVGWTQAGIPPTDATPMRLEAFRVPLRGLDGSFTLYLGRYLHLVVDLAMDAPAVAAEYEDEYGNVRPFEYALSPREGPVRYRIQEDRIFKNGEIRYFDHPKFGVVAKVIRIESSEDDADADLRPPLISQTVQ